MSAVDLSGISSSQLQVDDSLDVEERTSEVRNMCIAAPAEEGSAEGEQTAAPSSPPPKRAREGRCGWASPRPAHASQAPAHADTHAEGSVEVSGGTTEAGRTSVPSTPTTAAGARTGETAVVPQFAPLVFVWDLDETLIAYDRLSTDPDAVEHRNNAQKQLHELFWEVHKTLLPDSMVEDEQMHISIVERHDDGADLTDFDFATAPVASIKVDEEGVKKVVNLKHLAYRFRRVREEYSQATVTWTSDEFREKHARMIQSVHELSEDWIGTSTRVLQQCSELGQMVIVTSSSLVAALAKLLIFDLAKFFPIDNVYSAPGGRKAYIFKQLAKRFGPTCHYITVGDGGEEQAAAKLFGWPFIPVTARTDLFRVVPAAHVLRPYAPNPSDLMLSLISPSSTPAADASSSTSSAEKQHVHRRKSPTAASASAQAAMQIADCVGPRGGDIAPLAAAVAAKLDCTDLMVSEPPADAAEPLPCGE